MRARGADEIARLLDELSKSGGERQSHALAPENLPGTAGRFAELVILPILVRAIFGDDLATLRGEIGPHVREAVAFFLAACGQSEDARS
jgi:hypothetical protein